MPVTNHTSQPFGYLSGGASLALAESIAGHGSYLLCLENEFPCGIQVSGNHIKSVPIGKLVKGKGQIIHKGNTTHLWHIDIINEEEEIVSTARFVNHIIKSNSNKVSIIICQIMHGNPLQHIKKFYSNITKE